MTYCCVKSCTNSSKTCSFLKNGITFHRFPREAKYKKKWIAATRKKDWTPTQNSTICSVHFADGCISKSSNETHRRYLFFNAIPTKFLPEKEEGDVSDDEDIEDPPADTNNAENTTAISNKIIADDPMLSSVANFEDTQCSTSTAFNPVPPSEVYEETQPLSNSEFDPMLMLPSGVTFVDTTTETSNLAAFDLLPPSETIAEDGTVSSLLSLDTPISNTTTSKKKDSAVTNIEAAIDLLTANNLEDGKSGKKTAAKKHRSKKRKSTEEEESSDKPTNSKKRRKPLVNVATPPNGRTNNNIGESAKQEGNCTISKDSRVAAKKRKPIRKTVTDYDLLLASYKSAKSSPPTTSKLAELLMKPRVPASKNDKPAPTGNSDDAFEQLLASSKNSKDVPSIKDIPVGCEANSAFKGSLSNNKPYQSLDDPESEEGISNSLSDTETAFDSLLASFKSSREQMKSSKACNKNQTFKIETSKDSNESHSTSSKTDRNSDSVERSNQNNQTANKTDSKKDRSTFHIADSKNYQADIVISKKVMSLTQEESRKKDTHSNDSNNIKTSEKDRQPAKMHKASRAYNLLPDKEKQTNDHMDNVKNDRHVEDIPHLKKERHASSKSMSKRDQRRSKNIISSKIDSSTDYSPLSKKYKSREDPASKKYRRANKNRPAEKDALKKEKTAINCTALFDLLPPSTQKDRSRNDGEFNTMAKSMTSVDSTLARHNLVRKEQVSIADGDKVQDTFGDNETAEIGGPACNNEGALSLSTTSSIISEDSVSGIKDLASMDPFPANHMASGNGSLAYDRKVSYSVTDTVTHDVGTLINNTLTSDTPRTYEQSPSAGNYLALFDPRSPVMASEADMASGNNSSDVDCLPSYAPTFSQCANCNLESSVPRSVANDVEFDGNSITNAEDGQLTNKLAPINVPAANAAVFEDDRPVGNQTVSILSIGTDNLEDTQLNNCGAADLFTADIAISDDRSVSNDKPLDLSLSNTTNSENNQHQLPNETARSNVTAFHLLSSCPTNYERNHPETVETFELLTVGSSNYEDRQPSLAVFDLLASIPPTVDNRPPTNSGPAINFIPAFTENQPNRTNEVFEEMPVNLTNYVQHNSASTTADFDLLPNGIVNFEVPHNDSAAELNQSATRFKENQSTSYNMDLDFLPISPSNFDDQSTSNNATFDICTYVDDQSIGCDAAVLDLLPLGNDTFEEETTSEKAAAFDMSSIAADSSEVQLNSLMETALAEFCASIAAKSKLQNGNASSINISSLQARLASKLRRLPPVFQTDQETQCDTIVKVIKSKELYSKIARKNKQLKMLRSQVDFLNKKVATLRQSLKMLQKRNVGSKNWDVRQRKNKILKQRKIASKNGRIITKITLMVRPRDGDCADSVNQVLASTVK